MQYLVFFSDIFLSNLLMSFLLRLLRLRYLIFGTALGGGYAARKVKRTTTEIIVF